MKKLFLTIFCGFSLLGAVAQRLPYEISHDVRKGIEVVCPATHEHARTVVPMASEIAAKLNTKKMRSNSSFQAKSQIIMTYVGFPENAKNAFQRAVDIWANLVASDVPVRVVAYWQTLDKNVLGSAAPTDFRRNFLGATRANTWYPIALAEKVGGVELNGVDDYDIVCRFNKEIPWNLSTLPPAAGQFDFTSVVLHELCHGLGFTGSMDVEGDKGSWGYGSTSAFIYDTFALNGAGIALTDTSKIPNNSSVLKAELTSDNVFFSGELAKRANLNSFPRLYVPRTWEDGSSFSHLDDKTYPPGNINSLMTSSAAMEEVILDPGPVTLGIMADMGWKRTTIVHQPIKDYSTTPDIVVKATILSDTTIKEGTAKLIYSLTEFADSVVVPLKRVTGTQYEATIKSIGKPAKIIYYFTVEDNFGKKATSPPQAPRYIWSFQVGKKDTYGPLIAHFHQPIVPNTDQFVLEASVSEDFVEGLDTVYVAYTINGGATKTQGLLPEASRTDGKQLSQAADGSVNYLLKGAFGPLKTGDLVKYQIIAIDVAGNKTTLPTHYVGQSMDDAPVPTFYEMTSTELLSTQASYATDFSNKPATDFAMVGFSIGAMANFTSPLLYTNGGYPNGKGLLNPATGRVYQPFESNQIALLRLPIKKTADKANAIISFDEVVLVEPGEKGAVFGSDEFWDYVVVEASLDAGSTWGPVADGYDSNDDSKWYGEFVNNLTTGSAPFSTGSGTQALMKRRTINILDGNLKSVPAGTEMLIRFRLYSDQFVRGWGWVIDNLRIQEAAPVILGNLDEPSTSVVISPNPGVDFVQVNCPITSPQRVKIDVYTMLGKQQLAFETQVDTPNMSYKLDVRTLADGNYVVKISTKEGYKALRLQIVR